MASETIPVPVDRFVEPPATKGDEGPRRVGFEIELGGISIEGAVEDVIETFGGSANVISAYECVIADTEWGDHKVELDATILKERKYLSLLESMGIGPFKDEEVARIDTFVSRLASTVVPFEIVTAPIPIDKIEVIEDLRARLHTRGGEGTSDSLINAFGLHLNPEAPDLGVDSLLAHLQAFVLAFDWLKSAGQTDLARRITPFIDPFPKDYVTRILAADYRPDLQQFTEDYVDANPTRYRALDLLPILAHLSDHLPGAILSDVSARPAYHYRLPNCRVSDPDWRIATEWNRWVLIERLAANKDALREMAQAYLDEGGADWEKKAEQWLNDL